MPRQKGYALFPDMEREDIPAPSDKGGNVKTDRGYTMVKEKHPAPSSIQAGDRVVHTTFGDGEVTRYDPASRYLHIQFDCGEKMFLFPDVFVNGFATLAP